MRSEGGRVGVNLQPVDDPHSDPPPFKGREKSIHPAVSPPSIGRSMPVMKAAASDNR
jgi:hypothetical protein